MDKQITFQEFKIIQTIKYPHLENKWNHKKKEKNGLKDASKNIASIKLILYNFVKIQSRKNVYCKPNSTI
jgi:hypothetical protein